MSIWRLPMHVQNAVHLQLAYGNQVSVSYASEGTSAPSFIKALRSKQCNAGSSFFVQGGVYDSRRSECFT